MGAVHGFEANRHGSGSDSVSVCPLCGCRRLVRDHVNGELVCGCCGYVLVERRLDRRAEWSAFTLEEKNDHPRVGSPLNLMIYDKGLSTTFNPWETGISDPGRRQKLWRLRKCDNRSKLQSSEDRNLVSALNDLSNLGNRLSLPHNVLNTASRIYRQALEEDVIRGRAISKVVAACLYMACRRCGVVRRLDEISRVSHIHTREIAKFYRLLLWELDATVPRLGTRGIISRLVSKLGLRGETERLASLLLKEAEESRLTSGKHPAGIAASCIYISTRVTGERVTQEEVSHEAGITEVTIRTRYREILEKLDIIIHL